MSPQKKMKELVNAFKACARKDVSVTETYRRGMLAKHWLEECRDLVGDEKYDEWTQKTDALLKSIAPMLRN